MKTLKEIKAIYESEVEKRVQEQGISEGHSRWDIKDEVLDFLVETEFNDKLPTEDEEVMNWFEAECHIVSIYSNTECF